MPFQEFASNFKEDEKEKNQKPVYMVGIAVLLTVAIAYFAFNVFTTGENSRFEVESVNSKEDVAETKKIFVHVAGEVNNPGLQELDSDGRVSQAIELAGGATENADLNSVNLAKKCEDGEQIIIPAKVETEVDADGAADETLSGSAAKSSSGASTLQGSGGSTGAGKVNINTADASLLQTISGIGPSKAQKIIEYRKQNGSFKSVDDLTNVSGIGVKTLESIRSQICV